MQRFEVAIPPTLPVLYACYRHRVLLGGVFGLGQCQRVHGPISDQFSDAVSDLVSDHPIVVRLVTLD